MERAKQRWRDHRTFFFLRRSMRRSIFFWLTVTIVLSAGLMAIVLKMGGMEHPSEHRVLIGALAFFLLWTGAGALARRVARPLAELSRAAEALGTGNLKARVNVRHTRHGEARMVAEAFNRMAERVEQQMEGQRTLVAAVSHELRTPLSRIRFLTDSARSGNVAALGTIDGETVELDALVGDLLATSRLDFGVVERTTMKASDLVLRAVEAADADPSRVVVEAPEMMVAVDVTLAVRAVANLIENARRHGSGLIELRVSKVEGTCRIDVMDDGEGFSEEDRTRLFEPFFKGPNSRGTGLGLALVKRVAEAHGGSVSATHREPHGACLSLILPAA